MSAIISVIIPVYNTKKYVSLCIDSVIKQSYDNLEIVLVDDGSTDGSGELCDELAKKDERIKVFHQSNMGQSVARNKALEIAKGDYICFVDSDDFINKDLLTILYKMINVNNADLSVCECLQFLEDDYEFIEKNFVCDDITKLDGYEILEGHDKYKMLTDMKTKYSGPWAKLYKKELFRGIQFLEGHLHEDQRILADITLRVNKVVICDEQMYYYMTRSGSSTISKLTKSRMFDHIESVEYACELLKNAKIYDIQKEMARHTCNFIMFYYEEIVRQGLDNRAGLQRELRKKFKAVMKYNSNVFSIKQVMYCLFMINPSFGLWFKRRREKSIG